MNFKLIDDRMLLANTKDLARQEREILVGLLKHLKEIHRRRLFCDLKYDSMKEYVMKELKYSEDQADRRLSAMHLLNDLPEIEAAVESGSLTLTNLGLAQVVFHKTTMEREQKLEFVAQLKDKTTRAAAQMAHATCPEMKPKDLETFQLKDLDLRAKTKELQRHHGCKTLSDLLHKLFDEELARLQHKQPAAPAAPRRNSKAAIYRRVYRRDGGRCTNCQTPYRLQYEHIQPKAAGGKDTLENLKLLCRDCNLRQAVKYYGRVKMNSYIREPLTPYLPVSGQFSFSSGLRSGS